MPSDPCHGICGSRRCTLGQWQLLLLPRPFPFLEQWNGDVIAWCMQDNINPCGFFIIIKSAINTQVMCLLQPLPHPLLFPDTGWLFFLYFCQCPCYFPCCQHCCCCSNQRCQMIATSYNFYVAVLVADCWAAAAALCCGQIVAGWSLLFSYISVAVAVTPHCAVVHAASQRHFC